MSKRVAGVLALVLAVPVTLVGQGPGAGAAQGAAQGTPQGGGGRGNVTPASYPPYTRPVTKYVPPRTPDGQPDISGLYVGISLPRNIETPRAPAPPRRGSGAGGEYMYGMATRVALPEGAIARPAGVDPADGRIPLKPEAWERRKFIMANQTQLEHLDGRVMCLIPGVPRITVQ